MKRIGYILLYSLWVLLAACEKDTLPMNFSPTLTTGEATDIYRMGATLSGSIQRSGNVIVKDCGILLSELQSMAEYTELKAGDSESASLSVQVKDLQPGKTYYYCAYAGSGYSIARGEIKKFTTTESNAPVFDELQVTARDEKSLTVSVALLDEGGSELLLSGFCWKETDGSSGNPTTKDHVVNAMPEGETLRAQIKDLKADQEYLICAYGVNAKGVGYGKTVRVSTRLATVPTLSTPVAKDSTDLSITVASRILSKGETEVTEIGFCWSAETQEPTKQHLYQVLTEQLEQEEFGMRIGNLKAETTYYIRAYAVNGQGTGYGETYQFTTKKGVTLSITRVETTGTVATVYASMIGSENTEACYYQLSQDRNNMEQSVGNLIESIPRDQNGAFGWKIGGLQPNTTYYVRACYANAESDKTESEIKELKTQQPGIYTLEDLVAFRDSADDVRIKYIDENGTVNLYADIDLSVIENWTPIEVFAGWSAVKVLEGNGHSLLGLKMKYDKIEEWNAKGFINKNQGVIRNLHITGNIVIEDFDAEIAACGAICGLNMGIISGCSSDVNIDGTKVTSGRNVYVGGICGDNHKNSATDQGMGEMDNCVNRGSITGEHIHASGVVGNNYSGFVENCKNYGAITADSWCAGITLCFTSLAKVVGCENYGEIHGGESQAGGICSLVSGALVESCHNEGTVQGDGYVGGIVGTLADGATLQNCTNGGDVTGISAAATVGGICGALRSGCNYQNNVYGGTVNGAPGTEDNAIGLDERNADVSGGNIDNLPTHEW